MLLLDETTTRVFDGEGLPWGALMVGESDRTVPHLFTFVRERFDQAPTLMGSRDSDPLYRTHGDPRD